MSVQTSPQRAPEYSLYRDGIAAADVMSAVTKKHGLNSSMYENVHIQVIPAAGVDPSVEIWWWSDVADAFIKEHTPLAYAGAGAGIPYEFTVPSKGRILFVQVTATTGAVKIAASGFNQEQFS